MDMRIPPLNIYDYARAEPAETHNVSREIGRTPNQASLTL